MRFKHYWAADRKKLLTLAALAFLPLSLCAQQNRVTVEPSAPLILKRGSSAPAVLKVTVLEGYHVNSDKPKDEFLIPFRLTWTAGPVKTGDVAYPASQEVQVGSDRLRVFTGSFSVTTQVSAAADAPKGSSAITGKLHYQACNDRMCFRPVTMDVRIPVDIE